MELTLRDLAKVLFIFPTDEPIISSITHGCHPTQEIFPTRSISNPTTSRCSFPIIHLLLMRTVSSSSVKSFPKNLCSIMACFRNSFFFLGNLFHTCLRRSWNLWKLKRNHRNHWLCLLSMDRSRIWLMELMFVDDLPSYGNITVWDKEISICRDFFWGIGVVKFEIEFVFFRE